MLALNSCPSEGRGCGKSDAFWFHSSGRQSGSRSLQASLQSPSGLLRGPLRISCKGPALPATISGQWGRGCGQLGVLSTTLSLQPVGAGHDLFEGRPELSAWRHRVEAVLGKELVLDAHKTLLHPEEVAVDVDQLPPAVKEQLTQIVLKYVQ